MKSQPLLSVVLCTYNNADSLEITLRQLSAQLLDNPASVEVILVDNNSPDHTAAVVHQIGSESPITIRYFFESRQGLSYARNTGVEQSKGEYILFTDDDAELSVNWIAHYIKKIRELEPDCLYSKISIIWDKPIPWWYSNRYRPYFVGLDYGEKEMTVQDLKSEFFGKNFCLKKSLILFLGGFDPKLGRSGSRLIAGEETLIYRRLIQLKKSVLYFPDAPVGHRLKEREYTEENISKQFIDSAYSNYHIAKLTARKKVFGRPIGILISNIKSLMKSLIYLPLSWVARNHRDVFYHKINLNRSITLIKLWVMNNE